VSGEDEGLAEREKRKREKGGPADNECQKQSRRRLRTDSMPILEVARRIKKIEDV
jgi:hypothetical protein